MKGEKISFSNTLADIYRNYHSDVDISQLSENTQSQIMFFSDFLKRNKLISCRIQNIAIIPKQSFHRAYTVNVELSQLYQIDVLTDQLFFTTQKRYSQFYKLHKRIRKFKQLDIKFPKKTYLQSGTEISVTSQRMVSLNEFISSIMDLGDQYADVKFMFFDFLGLWDKYLQKGIDINNTQHEYFLASTQNIYIEILKLNEKPKSISSIFERIRKLIFEFKIKLSLETARQLFFGLDHQKKGLFYFAFQIDNQYLAIECLHLINDLLDTQKNKYSQLFLKTLQNCNIKKITIQKQQLLQNINYQQSYLQLIKHYHSKHEDKNLKLLFKTLTNQQST